MLAVFRLVVHESPEEHPDKAEGSDDDEGHLPAELDCKRRDEKRSGESAYRCSSIEYGGGEGPVLFREIFSSHLDGCRKVSGLSQGKDASAEEEQVDRCRGYSQRYVASCLDSLEGSRALDPVGEEDGGNAAAGMHAGTEGPHSDGDKVALLGPHPIDEFACEQAGDCVEDGEEGRDGSVVGVCPMELRFNELLIGE